MVIAVAIMVTSVMIAVTSTTSAAERACAAGDVDDDRDLGERRERWHRALPKRFPRSDNIV
jgi:hypothetical protein